MNRLLYSGKLFIVQIKVGLLAGLLVFLLASAFSFAGSLQLGPVNLYVINTTLFSSRRQALYVAAGGSIPEFLYSAMAVLAGSFLLQNALVFIILRASFSIVLLGLGVYLWLKKPGLNNIKAAQKNSGLSPFVKGFSLATLNPQLLPFWTFVLIYLNSLGLMQLDSTFHKVSFVIGSGLGAFALLSLLVYLTGRYKELIVKPLNSVGFFKALSVLFFALALHQIYLLLILIA